MGAEAKLYLSEHRIPQLFEGLMTGLIYNRPADPLSFLEKSLHHIKTHPNAEVTWDMFIDKGLSPAAHVFAPEIFFACRLCFALFGLPAAGSKRDDDVLTTGRSGEMRGDYGHADRKAIASKRANRTAAKENKENKEKETKEPENERRKSREKTTSSSSGRMGLVRTPSVIKAAQVAEIPSVPIVLFMGGPGGGKTRHAAKVAAALQDKGLVHICMPDVIRQALARYKDKYPEWREAHEHYSRGELIPNHLALSLVKAEMGRHKDATAFFLEGFPREARQVEDFERQVKSVNMALIIDYDEKTLRDHMEKRGLGMEIIDQKIKEFKQKTLPSAKYFDDQKLLHLIPGERDDQTIYERMKSLVTRAMDSGVPVINSNPPSQSAQRSENGTPPSPPKVVTPPRINGIEMEQEEAHDTPPAVVPIATVIEVPPTRAEVESEVVPQRPPTTQSRKTPPEPAPVPVPSVPPAVAPVAPVSVNNSRPPSVHSRKSIASQKSQKKSVSTPPKTPATAEKRELSASLSTGVSEVPRGLPNNAPVILLVGAPGALKNDVARRITQKYDGFVLISMGDLLRKYIADFPDDELWKRVAKKINEGEPIPTKLCRQILYSEIHKIGQGAWGFVIEGYPRTQSQLDDFEGMVSRVDVAILIDCTEQFCEQIVRKRFENEENRRADDAPDVFKVRLAAFKQNTLPMLKHLDEKGKLRVVDGDGDADSVFKEVSQVIDTALFIEEDDGSGGSLNESKKDSLNGPTHA